MTGGRPAKIMGHKGHTGHGHEALGGLLDIEQRLVEASRVGKTLWSTADNVCNCLGESPQLEDSGEHDGRAHFRSAAGLVDHPSPGRIVPAHGTHFSPTLGGEETQLKFAASNS